MVALRPGSGENPVDKDQSLAKIQRFKPEMAKI